MIASGSLVNKYIYFRFKSYQRWARYHMIKKWIPQIETDGTNEFCEADEQENKMVGVRISKLQEAWLGGDLWMKISEGK